MASWKTSQFERAHVERIHVKRINIAQELFSHPAHYQS